jgi:hypothetical protein
MFNQIADQGAIFKKWEKLINAEGDIRDEQIKMSTAVVLENAQRKIDERFKINNSRGLLTEAAIYGGDGLGNAGITAVGTMGPGEGATSIAATTGDARVPSVVIPMIRRIFPQLIAHKLVGVQPMQGPIGMAFAFRAKYGRFGRGAADTEGTEIGYLHNDAAFTGKKQLVNKFNNEAYAETNPEDPKAGFQQTKQDQGAVDEFKAVSVAADPQSGDYMKYFMGDQAFIKNGAMIGDGADTSDAEKSEFQTDIPNSTSVFGRHRDCAVHHWQRTYGVR